MGDAADQLLAMRFDDTREVTMCVALMQENWLSQFDSELQLPLERGPLIWLRREIAEVIEPAFADSQNVRVGCKCSELRHGMRIEIGGMVRMNSRGGPEHGRSYGNQFQCRACARNGASRNQHARDTGPTGSFDDIVAVVIEAVVAEIDADVDQWRSNVQ